MTRSRHAKLHMHHVSLVTSVVNVVGALARMGCFDVMDHHHLFFDIYDGQGCGRVLPTPRPHHHDMHDDGNRLNITSTCCLCGTT